MRFALHFLNSIILLDLLNAKNGKKKIVLKILDLSTFLCSAVYLFERQNMQLNKNLTFRNFFFLFKVIEFFNDV